MTYTFRKRFRLGDGDHLDANVHIITLADASDEGVVTLRPVERQMGVKQRDTLVSEAGELVLQGTGYVGADAAAAAGRRWWRYLVEALARELRGVDLGNDDCITPVTDILYGYKPPGLLQMIGIDKGDRAIIDNYEMMVFPTEPAPKFVNFLTGIANVEISGWLERFEQTVHRAREQDRQPWDKQKTLAYRLVHLALRDANLETRHIQLVTAVEVLLKDQPREKPVMDWLNKRLEEVTEWPENTTKRRIEDLLRDAKQESISRAGSEQVAAKLEGVYGNKSAADFFKCAYDIRSRLVHRTRRKTRRPTADDLSAIYVQLVTFVLDFLDAYETG